MSFQSLPGLELESPRSSTTGFYGWLLNTIVLRNLFLAGPSIDRAPVGALRQPMNLLMRLSVGLVIRIHGSEQHGRRANDWQSSSPIVEPCWFWMVWSRSKIRPAHKKDGCVSLPSRLYCAISLPS